MEYTKKELAILGILAVVAFTAPYWMTAIALWAGVI